MFSFLKFRPNLKVTIDSEQPTPTTAEIQYPPNTIISLLHQFVLFDISSFPEPVGSVRPKINIHDKFMVMEVSSHDTFAMLCPGQSYPIPVFR